MYELTCIYEVIIFACKARRSMFGALESVYFALLFVNYVYILSNSLTQLIIGK